MFFMCRFKPVDWLQNREIREPLCPAANQQAWKALSTNMKYQAECVPFCAYSVVSIIYPCSNIDRQQEWIDTTCEHENRTHPKHTETSACLLSPMISRRTLLESCDTFLKIVLVSKYFYSFLNFLELYPIVVYIHIILKKVQE